MASVQVESAVIVKILWGVACTAFGIVFTVLFSTFVDSYTRQVDTQQEILNRITGIEAQMIMADFPTLRSDLETLEAELNSLKDKHKIEIDNLNDKISSILTQIKEIKGG